MIELYAEDGHSSHHHQQRTGLGLGAPRILVFVEFWLVS